MLAFFRGKKKGRALPQPGPKPHLSAKHLDQSIAEMLSVIRKVLADGVVTEEEASALSVWTTGHPEVVEAWPGKVLVHRLKRIFQDGKVDEVERTDLQRLLKSLAVGDWGIRGGGGDSGGLPLTDPPPVLVFPGGKFAFSGEFAFGPREACEAAVIALGGTVTQGLTADTDVLVLGTFGAGTWNDSPDAKLLARALRLRGKGSPISVVSEDHWVSSLPGR